MELAIESAFSTGGLVGHLSYVFLVVAMAMRNMFWLRSLAIGSALTAIGYDYFWLNDPVGVFWESLLITVNITQLVVTFIQNKRATFSEEEQRFVHEHFGGLSPTLKRKILDAGSWSDGEAGLQLTHEGKTVQKLVYLASGEVRIHGADKTIGYCNAGEFIGEMAALTDWPASASAMMTKPSRYWAVDLEALRKLSDHNGEIKEALEGALSLNVLKKLIRSNESLANSGGIATGHGPE